MRNEDVIEYLQQFPADSEIITLTEAESLAKPAFDSDATGLARFGLVLQESPVPQVLGGVLELSLLVVTPESESEPEPVAQADGFPEHDSIQ